MKRNNTMKGFGMEWSEKWKWNGIKWNEHEMKLS